MSDEPTLPPVNTPRKALAWLWTWSETHTAIAVPIATFIAGWLLGKFL